MIVFLRLKCPCGTCKRYCRVEAHGQCPDCHREEFVREEENSFLLWVLSVVAAVPLGLLMVGLAFLCRRGVHLLLG